MRFLPYENVTYETPLAMQDVLRLLSENVDKERFNPLKRDRTKPFTGELEGRSFKVSRKIFYSNSFAPIVVGRVEDSSGCVVIKTRMRLHTFAMAIGAVWFGFLGMICANLLLLLLTSSASLGTPSLIPLLMIFMGYLLVIGGFKFESGKVRKEFQDLFRAKIAGGAPRQ